MPELAEVEYFRRRWDDGIGERVVRVELHREKRIFRGSDPDLIKKTLRGQKLLGSETRGKQIAFRFSKGAWLGIHLGMSGKLRVEAAHFAPDKHDHLSLFQKSRALIFSDPANVRTRSPSRWKRNAALVVLWQARLHPRVAAGALDNAAARELWRVMRSVCRVALKTIGVDWSDPPAGWLIHQRWKGNGRCPRDAIRLKHATVGGRTTAWCSRCQKLVRSQRAGAAA